MKQSIIVLHLVFLSLILQAQKSPNPQKIIGPYAKVDKKVMELPESLTHSTQEIADYVKLNFTTDSDKTRAIFIWTASNIRYDIDNMFAINFYEKQEEKIAKALKNRKGICENYAAVFNEICLKCGLKSFVITGYTKQNGFTDYIPHAWCATMVDNNWFLFDPTWGSGYISNGKFVKRIENSYYKVQPSKLVKSHMPFDPMWEFLNYPITNQEFYEGRVVENKSKPYFSYIDSIAVYEKLDSIEQYIAASRRVEGNGVKNALVFDRLAHLKREIEIYNNKKEVKSNNDKVELYNRAVIDFNDGISKFNIFIQYRNNQFKPMKPDPEIQEMLDGGYNKIKAAKDKLEKIDNPEPNIAKMIISLHKQVNEISTRFDEQEEWLHKYFSKGKFGRSTMFSKYTWMGIPLN